MSKSFVLLVHGLNYGCQGSRTRKFKQDVFASLYVLIYSLILGMSPSLSLRLLNPTAEVDTIITQPVAYYCSKV